MWQNLAGLSIYGLGLSGSDLGMVYRLKAAQSNPAHNVCGENLSADNQPTVGDAGISCVALVDAVPGKRLHCICFDEVR